jgi:hypothetical protein
MSKIIIYEKSNGEKGFVGADNILICDRLDAIAFFDQHDAHARIEELRKKYGADIKFTIERK